jgi:hypothetical protein
MAALFKVVPRDLYNTIQSDLIEKKLRKRVRSSTDLVAENAADHTDEWGDFTSILTSLLKDAHSRF